MKNYNVTIQTDVPFFKAVQVKADSEPEAEALVKAQIKAGKFTNKQISKVIEGYSGFGEHGWEVGHPDEIELDVVWTAEGTTKKSVRATS
jgi:hypothetical protein